MMTLARRTISRTCVPWPTRSVRLVVRTLFSDVDGAVLDRNGNYAMRADEIALYLPAVTIVLAWSRTKLERSRNQRDPGLPGPVFAEDAAVVAMPWHELLASAGTREEIDGRSWRMVVLASDATPMDGASDGGTQGIGNASTEKVCVGPTGVTVAPTIVPMLALYTPAGTRCA